MQTSQICIPEIGPNGASTSLINRTHVSMATGSGCGSSQQAATRRDPVGFLDNMADANCECRGFTHQYLISALNKNRKASYSDTDLTADSEDPYSDDSETATEDECEHFGKVTCRDLAWLNVNSNGRTATDGSNSEAEPTAEAKNTSRKRQMKQLSVGQTSFEPVGLSLSSSGVQLYMMVSSEDKEKLLTSAKPAPRGKEGKKATPNAAPKDPPDDSLVANNTSWTHLNEARDNENESSHNNSQRVVIQASRIGFHSADEPLQPGPCSKLTMAPQSSRRTFVCNSVDNHTRSSCRPKTSVKMSCGERSCAEAQSTSAGSCWRNENEEICTSNNEDNLHVPSLRHERVVHRHRCAHVTSKEKHFARHSFDTSKRHTTDLSPDGSKEKRAKRRHVDGYVHSPIDYADSHYANSSSDEDDEYMHCHEEQSVRDKKQAKTRTMTKHATQEKMYPPDHCRRTHEPTMADGRIMTDSRIMADNRIMTDSLIMADNRIMADSRIMARTMTDHADCQSISRSVAPASSSTTVFNSSRHNTSSMDPVTLAQFTEYTENMRRNIKQDYKNLSSLMKSFTDVVHERNNNQTSQSSSDFTQLEKAHKDNDRCTLM